jgi:alpha-L-fucosidase
MIRFFRLLLAAAMATVLVSTAAGPLRGSPAAAETPAKESTAERDARMKWWRDARFGMFIHWGVYSVPAGEWKDRKDLGEWFLEETHMPVSQYEKFAQQFNPVKFDAKKWVAIAKGAGMKYIVITSKHHDGFGMFPSQETDWCIKSTPFKRDPLKELSAACREAGIKFCLYHSIMDWHHPDWGTRRPWNDKATGKPDMDRYTAYMKRQLKELITNYGPLGVLWFDGEWESPWTAERGEDLYAYCRSLQPDIIINNRVGKARADMQGMDKGKGVGDYGTPEQTIPPTGFGPDVYWESCMTMNRHWGYNKNDHDWKSAKDLVRILVDCASKGGNFLLNVGPTSEGVIPPESVQRLKEVGQWMKVNGEAIYGTSAGPFKRGLPWGRATQKSGTGIASNVIGKDGICRSIVVDRTTLFLHVFDWPKDGKLFVPLSNPPDRVQLLATHEPLSASVNGTGIILRVPDEALDKIDSVIVLDFDGKPEVIQTRVKARADGMAMLKAADANIAGSAQVEEIDGAQNIGYWIDPATTVSWDVELPAGNYNVELCYAAETGSGGNQIRVVASDRSVGGTIRATGSWRKFETVSLGKLAVPSGTKTITLKPTKVSGPVMNLRWIKLSKAA